MTSPWLVTPDYIMGLGRVRLRKPGEMIQPYADRVFLSQHAEEIAHKIKDLGLVDGIVGVARPLSADSLVELGLTGLSPISIDAILPDFYQMHSTGFRDMRAFVAQMDRLVLQLKLLPALPDTPKALRALQRAVLTEEELRHWHGHGFYLREPGERLYDERMEAVGYDLDAMPWVLDSYEWILNPATLESFRRQGVTYEYDDDD